MGPEDRQFHDFYVSQFGRLRRLGFLLTGNWDEGEDGRPPVEVPTFRKKGFPFTFWVVAPSPGRPARSFTSFDAAGQELARGTEFAGYPNCRP